MKTSDPRRAKEYSKCIVKNARWTDEFETEVYEDICYEAAKQNEEYRESLLETGEEMLVEGVNGQFKWGSGMGIRATSCTLIEKLPGENRMGFILMAVRNKLIEAQVEERWDDFETDDQDKQNGMMQQGLNESKDGEQFGGIEENVDDDDEGQFIFPKKSTPKSQTTLQELEIDLDNKFDMYCGKSKNNPNEGGIDDDNTPHCKSFGKGMGRGLGRGKRTRTPSSPGASSSAQPTPKQTRTGQSPPKSLGPNTTVMKSVSDMPTYYSSESPGCDVDENYDESKSPGDW